LRALGYKPFLKAPLALLAVAFFFVTLHMALGEYAGEHVSPAAEASIRALRIEKATHLL
jgi:hypothetical protein